MGKLKLGPLVDDRPVRLTIEIPGALHRQLLAYGEALARETGHDSSIPPAKLVPPMLARFIDSDRAFAKHRRSPAQS
jgi:hypothetical protein